MTAPRALPVALFLAVASTGCYISSIRDPVRVHGAESRGENHLARLRLAVVGKNAFGVAQVQDQLEKTGLFASVRETSLERADLMVEANSIHKPYRCGLSALPLLLTFGLSTVRHEDPLELELVFRAASGETLDFAFSGTVESAYGLGALFLRFSSQWRNMGTGDILRAQTEALRQALLARAREIADIAVQPAA